MMKWRDQKGFSFLELSIVLAIMGMILLIGMPNYKTIVDKARQTTCDANRKLIETQLEHYYFDHFEYPSEEDAIAKLIEDNKYLKGEPICPAGDEPYAVNISAGSVEVECPNEHHASS